MLNFYNVFTFIIFFQFFFFFKRVGTQFPHNFEFGFYEFLDPSNGVGLGLVANPIRVA